MTDARRLLTAALAATAITLAGCAPADSPAPSPSTSPFSPGPTSSPSTSTPNTAAVRPVVDGATDLTTGLDAPWSVVVLSDGSALLSERDTGRVLEWLPGGGTREVGTIEGAAPRGEGGLLGLEVDADESLLYAMFTAADDNRIVAIELEGEPGARALGAASEVLTGIPKAPTHNGGRIAFGPDGMLYASTGDAGVAGAAQDRDSLAGKILRMTPEGGVPSDNPFDSLVYSLGHRNVQGLDWDTSGRLWASEFGQNTWDELNLIEAGGNYGWPEVEGAGGGEEFVDPVVQWTTDEASPSGLAVVDDTVFVAGLGGERLWAYYPGTDETESFFEGDYGRLRDVVEGADGGLWMMTNNTDGRGAPRDGDDRLVTVPLEPR